MHGRRLPAAAAILLVVSIAGVVIAVAGGAAKPAPVSRSPLDPLSAAELRTALHTIEADKRFPKGALFPIVQLLEPPKSDVLAGRHIRRRAFANVYDEPRNRLYEVVVDVSSRKVVSWTWIKGRQPSVTSSEFALAQKIIRRDPRWQHAIRLRGLNPKDVFLDVWSPGEIGLKGVKPGTRLVRAISDYRGKLPNVYDRPVEGVIAVVDMNRRKVVSVTDTGVRPVATTTSGVGHRLPNGLKPLLVTQPQGPSFTIHGSEVSWWNWRFRIGYTPREGLVLNQIGWSQRGAVRPVIYRMTFDDIYVPYSIPYSNWSWRTAFDVGEYDLGQYAEHLQKNVDVPNNAVFVDEAVAADDGSTVYALPHAVALYEQDAGSLWDRADPDTGLRDARFARELVVTSSYPIGNYTYTIEYVFRMDGGIDVRVGATGTTLNQGVSNSAQGEKYGAMVGPHIAAPSHQHFLNFRIDFDVDGTANRLVEENVHSLNQGNAFVTRDTLLGREQFRDLNPATDRAWLVESATRRNIFGRPTAYELIPAASAYPHSAAGYPALAKAAFARHPFWVTAYRNGETYATGPYPNQGPPRQGLASYAADRQSVAGRDLVVWYTASFTHIPIPENYPVMTRETFGFSLRPAGFFNQDPALNAP